MTLKTFTVVWLGQLFSVVGSSLTSFALGVWVFRQNGSVTQFALIGFCSVLPRVCFSPLAGAVIDRWERRRSMILADAGAGACTSILMLLLFNDRLMLWHIYVLVGISSSFSSLQWPAYTAAVSSLVNKKDLGRANGMIQFALATADVLSPSMAAFLLQRIQLTGTVIVDLATFVFAVLSLLLVRFPEPRERIARESNRTSLREDIAYGWKYIFARGPLAGLLSLSAASYFLWGLVAALITPMILGFTSTESLGALLSTAGAGMILGALAMSLWGGPKRRIDGVIRFEFLSGICFCLIGLRPSFWTVAAGVFGAHLTIAVIGGSGQAIWQAKVAQLAQGRVFATQQMLERAASPLAYLVAGPLVEWNTLTRAFAPDGALTGSLGRVIGTGSGRGIGLVFIMMGIVKMLIAITAQRNDRLRGIEEELPDGGGELSLTASR